MVVMFQFSEVREAVTDRSGRKSVFGLFGSMLMFDLLGKQRGQHRRGRTHIFLAQRIDVGG